ncbi:MAG: replicative DNA helicase [bacterium]
MATGIPTPAAAPRLDRVPPHSEEAERGVLGCLLLDSARVLDLCLAQQLSADAFYHPAHRAVFEVCLEMVSESRPIDLLTVTERFRSTNLIDRIGGPAVLDQLVDAIPTAAHAEYYIDLVRQKYLLRTVIDRAREAERLCYAEEGRADEVLGQVEQSFYEISERQHGQMPSWPSVVTALVGEIEAIKSGQHVMAGISTGFLDLDKVLLGLRPSNLIILAARPAMGKTSLAMNIVENVTAGTANYRGPPRPVGVFSLEMSCADLARRMICCRAEVSSHQVMQGIVTAPNHRKLVNAVDCLSKAPIFLDDTAGLDIMELRSRARRMQKKHKVELIVIDYLQLVRSEAFARQSREREIAHVSATLKGMAKELNIPVLVLSQLNRNPETRDKQGVPKISDLRDSGSLEQDADVVLLLRRPCKNPDDPRYDESMPGLAIVDVAKHRNGPTNDEVRLLFDEDFTRFRDCVRNVSGGPPPNGDNGGMRQ